MKRWLWIICALAMSGCAVRSNPETNAQSRVNQNPDSLPDIKLVNYGQAPEIRNDIWLNSNKPLRLNDLKGKVVLLEMWTFG